MDAPEPCPRCAALRDDDPHPRCSARTCGCPCRDLRVDLHSPDTRLAVAQLCQSLLKKEFVKGQSAEAAYVNALIQDLLWSEMESLTGARAETAGVENSNLSVDEILSVRAILEQPALTPEEIAALRRLATVAEVLVQAAQGRRLPPPQAIQQPQPEVLPAEPAPRPVAPAPAPRARPAPHKGPLPMPSRAAMSMVTAEQSVRAASMAQRAADMRLAGQMSQSPQTLQQIQPGEVNDAT